MRLSRSDTLWLSSLLVLIAATITSSFSNAFSQPEPIERRLFRGGEDRLWQTFLGKPCTLIEEVPIVGQSLGISPLAATLSSMVGYDQRRLPFAGLHARTRLQELSATSLFAGLDEGGREFLAEAIRQNTDMQFERFLKVARAYPDATEGALRGSVLEQYGPLKLTQMLEKFTQDRLEAVQVQTRSLAGLWGIEEVRDPVDAKRPAALVVGVGGAQFIFTLVGYFREGEAIIVIDPRGARPKKVPAVEALLTEQDRVSTKELAKRVRQRLDKQVVFLDEATSCTATSRPEGLRFLTLHPGPAELHFVQSWKLDEGELARRVRRR